MSYLVNRSKNVSLRGIISGICAWVGKPTVTNDAQHGAGAHNDP